MSYQIINGRPALQSGGGWRFLHTGSPDRGEDEFEAFGDHYDVLPPEQLRECNLSMYDAQVYDQGSNGSGAAYAAVTAFNVARCMTGQHSQKFMPGLLADRVTGGEDANVALTDVLVHMRDQGVPPAGGGNLEEEMGKFKLQDAYHCGTYEEICSAISQGFPVVFSVPVGPGFSRRDEHGVAMPLDMTMGRQAMCGVGLKQHPTTGEWLIKAQNSWGHQFGDDGCTYLSSTHFTAGFEAFAIVVEGQQALAFDEDHPKTEPVRGDQESDQQFQNRKNQLNFLHRRAWLADEREALRSQEEEDEKFAKAEEEQLQKDAEEEQAWRNKWDAKRDEKGDLKPEDMERFREEERERMRQFFSQKQARMSRAANRRANTVRTPPQGMYAAHPAALQTGVEPGVRDHRNSHMGTDPDHGQSYLQSPPGPAKVGGTLPPLHRDSHSNIDAVDPKTGQVLTHLRGPVKIETSPPPGPRARTAQEAAAVTPRQAPVTEDVTRTKLGKPGEYVVSEPAPMINHPESAQPSRQDASGRAPGHSGFMGAPNYVEGVTDTEKKVEDTYMKQKNKEAEQKKAEEAKPQEAKPEAPKPGDTESAKKGWRERPTPAPTEADRKGWLEPPPSVGNDELDRAVDTDKPVRVVDKAEKKAEEQKKEGDKKPLLPTTSSPQGPPKSNGK